MWPNQVVHRNLAKSRLQPSDLALSGYVPKTSLYPVRIGIFVNAVNFPKYKHLAEYRPEIPETNGPVRLASFFFMLKDIDIRALSIKGLYFDPARSSWDTAVFPFPDVVYMRKMPDPQDKKERAFLELLIKLRIPLVNSLPIFDKWQVHQALSRQLRISPYLPETRLYHKHSHDLTEMLRLYKKVYLKARQGSRGREVMQVSLLHGGRLEYRYFDGKLFSGIVDQQFFHRVLDGFFGDRGFIIQQPIDLITFNDSVVDLRAEMQRNGEGWLEIIAVPVRVGCSRSPITTHGTCFRFEHFFSDLLNYNLSALEELSEDLRTLLFHIYQALEITYGPFGELGLDIGLDKNKRLWLIECNSQSAKVSLMNAYGGSTVRKAFTNPLQYAQYLAGQKP